ncbi:MAG: FecR domain-containing protein [SAR324 cluster bacterium]|nr:FecR domain-containing protein [SAR324 cluster bacterium]
MKPYKIVISLLLCCLYSSALLADSLGSLYLNKGKVKIHRNSEDLIIEQTREAVPVFNKDEIQTGMETRVKIKLNAKEDEIELYSLTLFKLEEVTAEKNEVSMLTGKARFLIQKSRIPKNPNRRFRVRTTNALVGVKETEFVVGCEDGITSVLALSGIVTLSNITELDVAVDLGINHISSVNQTARPTIPIAVPIEIRQSIISKDSAESFKEIKFGAVISALQIEKKSIKDKNAQNNESLKGSSAEGITTVNPSDRTGEETEEIKETEDIDIGAELDTIEDSIGEITEEAEEQQAELQTIEIKIVN